MESEKPDDATREATISCLKDWLGMKIARNYDSDLARAYFQYLENEILSDCFARMYIQKDTIAEATSKDYLLRAWPHNLEALCKDIFNIREEAQEQKFAVAGFSRSLYEERISPFIEYGETLVSIIDTLATKISMALDIPVKEHEVDTLLIERFQMFQGFVAHFQKFDELYGVFQVTRAEQRMLSVGVIKGIKRRNAITNAYIPTLYNTVFKDLKVKFGL